MIIRAHWVLTMAGPPIPDGAVWVENERIRAVGAFGDVKREARGERIDLGDAVLLPGLVNAHCHLELTDMCGQVPLDGGSTGWLKRIVAVKNAWQASDYEASALRGVEMLLGSGTTTVCDIESWWPVAAKLRAAKLRVWHCLEMIDFAGQRPWREWIASAESWFAKVENRQGGWGLSPHAPYTATAELYRASADLMRREDLAGLILTTHVGESADEREMFEQGGGPLYEWLVRLGRDMYDCGGVSPLELLQRHGVLGNRTLGVHLNGLDEAEVSLVARTGMSVVHCPSSHEFFGHERFPLEQLLAAGVNVCVGTDSLASARAGATLDLFAELRRLRRAFPGLPGETVLKLATVNGARALQSADRLGTLEPGREADLIALRLPSNVGESDIYESVVSAKLPLSLVMIGGELIMR